MCPRRLWRNWLFRRLAGVALGAPVDSVVIGADTIVTFDGVIFWEA